MAYQAAFRGYVQRIEEKQAGDNNVTNIGLAVKGKKKDGEEYPPTFWVSIAAWGSYGEMLFDNISKGDYCYFNGKIEITEGDDGTLYHNMVQIIDWNNMSGGGSSNKSSGRKRNSGGGRNRNSGGGSQQGGYDEQDDLPF